MDTPRLRIFAGPNGSGKSTLKGIVEQILAPTHPHWLGVYINPDEMLAGIQACGFLDLAAYRVEPSLKELQAFFESSTLLRKANLLGDARALRLADGKLDFTGLEANAYHASVVSDFLRRKLLENRQTISFETVMSSPDKVELLAEAQQRGYRTYLYFVATSSPKINVARVRLRVSQGGHDVPVEKITQRYFRSLDLLPHAIRNANRAYLFDNSQDKGKSVWVAEITGGNQWEMKSDFTPTWFPAQVKQAGLSL